MKKYKHLQITKDYQIVNLMDWQVHQEIKVDN